MSVALLLITHDSIARSLLETASSMLGSCPLVTEVISVNQDFDLEQDLPRIKRLCTKIQKEDGLLILTDMYGATPSNIAIQLMLQHSSRIVITGLNLSMLIRVFNYAKLSLADLAEKAESGAKDGVLMINRQTQSSC